MQIVNVRGMTPNDPSIVYCGRACGGWDASPLANPFKIGKDGTREECLWKYAAYLATQLERHARPLRVTPQEALAGFKISAIRIAWKELTRDSVLGCWCAPKPCHCEVIAWLWEGMQS
jgi:hypothetical protein